MPIRRLFKVEGSQSQATAPQRVELQISPSKPSPPEEEEAKNDLPEAEPIVDSGVQSRNSDASIEPLKSPLPVLSPEPPIHEEIPEPPQHVIIPGTNKILFNLTAEPKRMDQSDDAMSVAMTEDDDGQSVIGVSDTDGRIRKRSINYENPELVKLIKSVGKPGFKPISEGPLSSLSEVSKDCDANALEIPLRKLIIRSGKAGTVHSGSREAMAPIVFSSPVKKVTFSGHRPSSKHLLLGAEKEEDQKNPNRPGAVSEENENTAPGSAATAAVDTIFDMFKNTETGKLPVRKFLNALTANGIRTTDPRLDESMHKMRSIMKRYGADFGAAETLQVDEKEFKETIRPNAMTISRFLRTNFVVPEWNEFCRHIFRLYATCKNNKEGANSDFIPQLANMDSNLWGIAVCSVDGQRFSTGDYNVPFCLQATSRVLNYAIALNDHGAEKVHSYVGQEPSGRDAKELVLDENNKPHNPMINSGAIVVASVLKAEEKHMADRFDAVHNVYKKMAGNNEFIGFLNQSYLSERQISYRNYAMGYFLRENKCLPEPERLNETIELMLQLCSVEVSCESLAVMAATLANGGVCPITGEYVIDSNCVRDVLSLMYTTGMNDYSGQFAFKVGLPAKSSISGAIMLVIPNVMGIALWSPPLDNRRNSVRGVQFCTELVKTFNFHNYDNLRFTQKKLDPRKMQVENKAHQVVLTLFSAANGDLTALSRFYLQGVDLTVADYDRRTPLHIAAAEGHLPCVKFLVEKARVPCRPVDRWNNTPADDARYHNHSEIADYLENWDMKRVPAITPHVPPLPSLPLVNGPPAKIDDKPSAFSTSGYEASQSEEEDDSGAESSMPGSASGFVNRH